MRNNANPVSSESVLKVFRRFACLELRKLAVELGVDAANAMLRMAIGDLERNGKIRRIGSSRGRHTLFVLATFEG